MFRTDKREIKDKNHQINWVGLECDIKGVGTNQDGKECYQAVKVNGIIRKEEYLNGATCDEELDTAPEWLYHVPKKVEQIDLTIDHEGEKNELFFNTLKVRAKNNGFSYREYCKQAHIINNYVLPEGLSEEELEHAIREEAWDELTAEGTSQSKTKVFPIIADSVIKDLNCILDNGKIAFWDNKLVRYITNEVVLQGYLQQKYKQQNITTKNMVEVYDQMKIQMSNDKNLQRKRDPEYVVCGKQLVSMLQNKVIPNTRNIYTDICYDYPIMSPEEITNYEKENKLGYRFLNDISCNDEITKQAICECLGCMLAPTKDFQKIFVLFGKR